MFQGILWLGDPLCWGYGRHEENRIMIVLEVCSEGKTNMGKGMEGAMGLRGNITLRKRNGSLV